MSVNPNRIAITPPESDQANAQGGYSPATAVPSPHFEFTPTGAEFQIGDITYNYLGTTPTGMEFTTRDANNVTRPLLVYRSSSQGSYRVSQGYETMSDGRPRLMKGAELSQLGQYTQDTQLHPIFDEKIGRIEETRELRKLPQRQDKAYDPSSSEALMRDFQEQVTVHSVGDARVDALLQKMPGGFSKTDVKRITGIDPEKNESAAAMALKEKIDGLNKLLRDSDIMPDFSGEPVTETLTDHPLLGNIVRETFAKDVNGVVYHWEMAHDLNGRSWIERIRLADAEPSAYGTDKQMVYSGMLTTKPLDYVSQSDGLYSKWVNKMDNGYNDISWFLHYLAPVSDYNANYHRRDQFHHFVSLVA